LKFGTSALFCLVFMAMSINVQAQYNLTYNKTSGQCGPIDPTVIIGLNNSTLNNTHVLFRVNLDATYTPKYTQVGLVMNNFGGPIQFGQYNEPGKYVAYRYVPGAYHELVGANDLASYGTGTLQDDEFWIIGTPAERDLSFTGTEGTDYQLEGTTAVYCNSGSLTLTNPEYSPAAYGSQWNVTYTLLLNGNPLTTDIHGNSYTASNPVVNPNASTIVWNNLPSGTYTVKAERTPCTAITFPTPGKSIIVIPDVTSIPVVVDPINAIYSVTGTPIILPVHIVYPTITPEQADPSVNIDSRISTTLAGGFPANTTILNITYNGIDVLAGTYEMGGKNNVLLSDILGLATPGRLIDQSGQNITWLITLKSETDATIPAKIETITYRGDVTNTFCTGVLNDEEFTLKFAPVTTSTIPDVTACNEPVVFDFTITYPEILRVNEDVKSDAKISVYKDAGLTTAWNINAGAQIAVSFNGTLVNTYTVPSDANVFYLSTLLGISPVPFQGHSGPDAWSFSVTNLDASTYYIGIQNMAILYGTEYVYASQDFKLIHVGAAGITIDPISDIQTACNAPVVFTANVHYPQGTGLTLADQNIDPSVMADALITITPAPTAGSKIAQIQYNGSVVPITPYIFDGTTTEVLLSSIIGPPAPTSLLGHSGIATDTWKISVENLLHPGAKGSDYLVTLKSIAYVNYTTCYTELASKEFTVSPQDLVIDPIANISTISGTPVIIPIHVQYPAISDYDNTIKVDASISTTFTDGFPTGTKIIGISTDHGATNLIGAPINVSGQSSLLLSSLLGISPVQFTLENGKAYTWEITVVSDPSLSTSTVIPVKVQSIVNYSLLGGPFVLAERDFTLTYAQETTSTIPDVADCGIVSFDFTINYPTIQNVDTRVKNDAKISIYKDAGLGTTWNINEGAVISIWYDGVPVTPSYTVPAGGSHEFLLSTLVGGGAPYPLQGHSGSDLWHFEISGVTPSTYFVKIENMAVLNSIDYVYATQDFKVIKVGATGVTVNEPMGTISTVAGAPLQFEVTVAYPNLVAQNIDPSVLVDALITSNVPLSPDATVAQIKYNGSVVPLNGITAIGEKSSIRLSEIIGTDPVALLGHSGLEDKWTITLKDVITGSCATKYAALEITMKSIAFVDNLTQPCPVVLGEDMLEYNTGCLGVTASTVAPVCNGSEITGSHFTFQYPSITGNPTSITTDSKITCDVAIPADVTIGWSYNSGAASGSYTVTDAIPAGTALYLSTIVGSPAPTPLEGHNGLLTTWDFTFGNVPVGVYHLTVVPIASMASPILEEVLTTDPASITQTLTVLANPDATISGATTVYSGEQNIAYSVPVADGSSPYPFYTWTLSAGSTTLSYSGREISIDWSWPFTGNATLSVTVYNGICSTTNHITITVKPNTLYGQVKYWNAQESPMPSPFNTNYYGMTVPDYFYVALVENYDKKDGGSFDPIDAIEIQKVEPNWIEDGTTITEYLSSFMFDYNYNPASEYGVVVWDGGYLEENPSIGDGYLGQTWTWNNWGGVNATDALAIQHMAAGNTLPFHWVGLPSATPQYGFFAEELADVNNSGMLKISNPITALDALITSRRAVGYIPTFTNNKPNFEVAGKLVPFVDFNTNNTFTNSLSATPGSRPNIEFYNEYNNYNWSTFALEHVYVTEPNTFVAGDNFLNIYYSAVGDINASYVPEYGGFKAKPAMELTVDNQLEVSKGEIVDIPVRLESGADLGAITLGLNYRNDLIEVVGVNYSEDFARIDAEKGNVQIAWFNTDGQHFNANDAIATLKVRVLADIDANTPLFELQNAEIADNSATVIEGNNLKTVALATNLNANSTELRAENYPNPFNEKTTISYNLPETGNVQLVIYNKMGQVVKTVVNGIQQAGLQTIDLNRSDLMSGVYYYRITLHGVSSDYSVTKNMIVVQ